MNKNIITVSLDGLYFVSGKEDRGSAALESQTLLVARHLQIANGFLPCDFQTPRQINQH